MKPRVRSEGLDSDSTIETHEWDTSTTAIWLFGFILFGIVCFALYALTVGSATDGASVFAVGCLIAIACLLVGVLLGFLFGIPRTLQQGDHLNNSASTADPPSAKDTARRRRTYQVNTNLEEISDWLTKIIVGVGLTELRSVPRLLSALVAYFAPGLGLPPKARVVAAALIIFYLVCGFLAGYLITRLFLAGAFSRADDLLQAAKESISRLVNADLDLSLTIGERAILSDLLAAHDRKEEFRLPADFRRESEHHQNLRALKSRYLIRPLEGGSWQPNKRVVLTPIALTSLDQVRRAVEGPRR
jgi:hypothetical protein